MSTHETDVVRYHTAGRRQPQLIGKDPSGMPIWGGPYTLYQAAGLLLIPLMWMTRNWWAGDLSGLAVLAAIAVTTAGTIWLLGRIDFSGRNVIYAAAALLSAWGTAIRRSTPLPLRRRGVRAIGSPICTQLRLFPASEPAPEPVAEPAVEPVAEPAVELESQPAADERSIPARAAEVSSGSDPPQAAAALPSKASPRSSGTPTTRTSSSPPGPEAHKVPTRLDAAQHEQRLSPLEAFLAAARKVS